ncbi:hypothetical protein Srubr_55320 [Streptomyces rubradiris]|uniref:Uncharacterized protein n=1 Tax=Streptomyces rubradiris TaxID=285531 RepID=A0ABQ3RIK2_STRRR|nr:hypothetical protein GCM10018792_27190 [Streptomyces rubradiris]GHI55686.1 hypothetical protein Srubr_55320 [Streptomyces rubradiris]
MGEEVGVVGDAPSVDGRLSGRLRAAGPVFARSGRLRAAGPVFARSSSPVLPQPGRLAGLPPLAS